MSVLMGGVLPPATLLGPAYVLDYNAQSNFWEAGTDPDVEEIFNQGVFGSGANLTQTTESQRLHAVVDSGFPAWEGNAAASRYMGANPAGGNILSAGDNATIWSVGRITSVTGCMIELGPNGAVQNIGLLLMRFADTLYARCHSTNEGALRDATVAFSDITAPHVMRATMDGSNIIVALDGTETVGATATGGLTNNCDAVEIGRTFAGSAYGDAFHMRTIVAKGPTADQISAMDDLLIKRYL